MAAAIAPASSTTLQRATEVPSDIVTEVTREPFKHSIVVISDTNVTTTTKVPFLVVQKALTDLMTLRLPEGSAETVKEAVRNSVGLSHNRNKDKSYPVDTFFDWLKFFAIKLKEFCDWKLLPDALPQLREVPTDHAVAIFSNEELTFCPMVHKPACFFLAFTWLSNGSAFGTLLLRGHEPTDTLVVNNPREKKAWSLIPDVTADYLVDKQMFPLPVAKLVSSYAFSYISLNDSILNIVTMKAYPIAHREYVARSPSGSGAVTLGQPLNIKYGQSNYRGYLQIDPKSVSLNRIKNVTLDQNEVATQETFRAAVNQKVHNVATTKW